MSSRRLSRAGLGEARRYGVTSVHDMYLSRFWSPNDSLSDLIQLLRRAESEGWLTCRFYVLSSDRAVGAAGEAKALGAPAAISCGSEP